MLASRGGVFGEAKAFADRIDTIELIAGPWIQNSANVGLEALDAGRMRRALAVLGDLGVQLMNAPDDSALFTDLAAPPAAPGMIRLEGACQRGTHPDVPGQACVRIRTTCGGTSADGELRITSAADGLAGSRGVIVLGSGSLGRDFFAGVDRPASRAVLEPAIELVGRLREAGYTVVERAWDAEAGWFGGVGGWRARSCHLAALYADVATWSEVPLCGVGFSAGGIELAYAMAWHETDALLEHAILGGGPAGAPDAICAGTTDCAGAHAAYPSSCAPEALTCAPGQLALAIDASHGGARLCRDLAGPDDPGRVTLEADRLDHAPGGLAFDAPVDLVWGAEDCLTIAAQGRLVADALRAAGTPVTTTVVPGVPHELPQHRAGVDAIFELLDARCGAAP